MNTVGQEAIRLCFVLSTLIYVNSHQDFVNVFAWALLIVSKASTSFSGALKCLFKVYTEMILVGVGGRNRSMSTRPASCK